MGYFCEHPKLVQLGNAGARMLQVGFIVLLSSQSLSKVLTGVISLHRYYSIHVAGFHKHSQMPGVTALLFGTNCLEISF